MAEWLVLQTLDHKILALNHTWQNSAHDYCFSKAASVAQLDARQTGDQEVAGSTPAGSATFFVEIGHEIFLRTFSPSR